MSLGKRSGPAIRARRLPMRFGQPAILRHSFLKAAPMSERRVGLWMIGACGGVGTTVALGLAALKRGLIDTTSMVTALPLFDGIDLDAPGDFVLGGHEVRRTSYRQAVKELQQRSNIFEPAVADACMDDLDE